MHRSAPATAATRAYSAGGVRSVVDKVDDDPMMQEMGGTHMKGQTNKNIEAPQNYGFTSVVMPGTKDKDGNVTEGAEAFISFMGGNQSLAICQVMDDRRYRLKGLKPGDTAFYDHQQHQFHFNKDGAFLTGLNKKKIRLQLADPDEDQQQSSGSSSGSGSSGTGLAVEALAEGGSTTGSGASSETGGGQKKKGQKERYKKESKRFVDINEKKTDVQHDADINVKSGKTLALEGQAIKRKAGAHYFDGDVHITGNLRVSLQAYKPSNGEWLAGTASPGPTDADDPAEYVLRPPPPLTAEQEAALARKRALADKIKITDDGIFIDGDLAVTGNLTVTGIVRAKGFETITNA
jgi:Bacteriophage Mu Gp45 spike protein